MTEQQIEEVMGLVEDFARASEGFPDYYCWAEVVEAKNAIRTKLAEFLNPSEPKPCEQPS